MSGYGTCTQLKLRLGILKPDKGEISYGRYELSNTDQRTLLRFEGFPFARFTRQPGFAQGGAGRETEQGQESTE